MVLQGYNKPFFYFAFFMRILLCNDDGYRAPGLNALYHAIEDLADVIVIAPEHNCSSASQSLSLTRPLKVERAPNGFFYLNGTPADCVHLALHGFLDDLPDLVISGINHGANLGEDTIYSGTVAAAIEGHLRGIPALASSFCCGHQARHLKIHDFEKAAILVRDVVLKMIAKPKPWLLNLNIPMADAIQGIKITKLGRRKSAGSAIATDSPRDGVLFWIGHVGEPLIEETDTDFYAISQHYASLTPLQIDLTHHTHLNALNDWMNNA